MSERRQLPNRRQTTRIKVIWREQTYHVDFGHGRDGAVAEVFVAGAKEGTDMKHLASDAAVALSIGLQYGVPPDAFAKSMSRTPNNEPGSLLGAVADALAREIEL